MQIVCDTSPGTNYKSHSQQARAISEFWYEQNVYCFACESNSVIKTKNNTVGNDFICKNCDHHYELKTFQRRPSKLPDGAYSSMIRKIKEGRASTFCLLQRDEDWHIESLTAIHSSFLLPDLISKRKPLGPNARRAGWVGCDLKLNLIQIDAEIPVITNGVPEPAVEVRRKFKKFLPLANKPVEARGWTLLTLKIIRELQKSSFSLTDLYEREEKFTVQYPNNLHVKDKIRQQLQILRDMDVLMFKGNGKYSILI